MEELEPRVLFSADFPGVVADPAAQGLEELVTPLPISEVLQTEQPTRKDSKASDNASTQQRQLVFIDAGAPNYQQLFNDLMRAAAEGRPVEVVVLDDSRDGIEQINEAIAERENLAAVHIVSHGGDGSLQLGNTRLDGDSLRRYAQAMGSWNDSLAEGADLLLYGCDLASTDEGKALVDSLAELTGADVAASTDRTGHEALGGDWDLEYREGDIEANLAFSEQLQDDWTGSLATVVVDNATDLDNGDTSSIANLILSDGGDGISLREAILAANATANSGAPDRIHFNIGSGQQTIAITGSALAPISEAIVIDATTQPGFGGEPLIELDGSSAGAGATGILLNPGSDGSTIRGLIVNRFLLNGIEVQSNNNLIVGNWVGLNSTGSATAPNISDGIEVDGSNNTIGGTTVADRNVVSGNTRHGIFFDGGTNNLVQGNYVGTDKTGDFDRGNIMHGIFFDSNADGNTVGGTSVDARNVISGNSDDAVHIQDSDNNLVQGNYLGVKASDSTGLGNSDEGVQIDGGVGNTIGGTAPGAGNVISGNNGFGMSIRGSSTTANVVQGNFVGTDVTGLISVANNSAGIRLSASANGNIIGGTVAGARNIISGGNEEGILMDGTGVTGNLVQGNYIGLGADGVTSLGNSLDGIRITNADNNTVGGSAPGAGNVISANVDDGLDIRNATADGNVVQGNLIGTDATGLLAKGNLKRGIFVNNSATNTTIGGTSSGEGNTIAHNTLAGVYINSGATGAVVSGNSIHSNGGLGIDLENVGVDENDVGPPHDTDVGANELVNFPVLTTAIIAGNQLLVDGFLNSTAGVSFRIEFFASSIVDASGNGEGEQYLGFTTVLTDGSGNANFSAALNASIGSRQFITATATDITGPSLNTSEFGDAITVANLLVVNTTSDAVDGDTSSIANLKVTPGANGHISLREAIEAVEATTNVGYPDYIHFDFDDGFFSPGVNGEYTIAVTGPGSTTSRKRSSSTARRSRATRADQSSRSTAARYPEAKSESGSTPDRMARQFVG